MYSPWSRTPKCTLPAGACPPAATVPMTSPADTASPGDRSLSTGSNVDTSPAPWSIVISGRSTTTPRKATTPDAGERTSPDAARSMPR